MATARSCMTWRKSGVATVSLLNCKPEETTADVVINWFNSDRTHDVTYMDAPGRTKTVLKAQFPFNTISDDHSICKFQKRIESFLNYSLKTFRYSFAWSVDKMQASALEHVLRTSRDYLARGTQQEVSILLCTQESHKLESAANVCCQVLSSWKAENIPGASFVKARYNSSSKNTSSTSQDHVHRRNEFSSRAEHDNHVGDVFITKENVRVHVCVGDILDMSVDCLVNAANTDLRHNSGVAKAIADKAGKQLVDECSKYLNTKGKLRVGDVLRTKPGNLPCKYVIHTVGPNWEMYKPHTKENILDCESDLKTSVFNSLLSAEGFKTIAMPTISSGQFAVPKEICAVQYARAILEYSSMARATLNEIYIVDFNRETIDSVKRTFKSMIPSGQIPSFYKTEVHSEHKYPGTNLSSGGRNHTAQSGVHVKQPNKGLKEVVYPYCHEEIPPGQLHKQFTCCFSRMQKLHVYTGNILNLTGVEMIVCGNNAMGNQGKLSKALSVRCGALYEKEKTDKFRGKHDLGDIIVLGSGNLKSFKCIAHAVFTGKYNPNDRRSQEKADIVFRNIYKMLKFQGCHSLALPLLGTTTGKTSPSFIAERLVHNLMQFCKNEASFPVNIHLVHKESDKTQAAVDSIKVYLRNVKCWMVKEEIFDQKGNTQRNTTESRLQKHNQTHHFSGSLINQVKGEFDAIHDVNNLAETQFKRKTPGYSENDTFTGGKNAHEPQEKFKAITEAVQHDEVDDQFSRSASGNTTDANKHQIIGDRETDDANQAQLTEQCVICMDKPKTPKNLPCGHMFCTQCIEDYFTYKESCPTCGRICGIITGDQPKGEMKVKFNEKEDCVGYEGLGRIEITYKFESGIQGKKHPNPGKPYKGIERTAYLPYNKRGRDICAMLQVAFDRDLLFTIGPSRTKGIDGVITWNDIHHKTDPKPHTQFGYPDPTYLDRVTDELKIKGVTLDDIPSISTSYPRR